MISLQDCIALCDLTEEEVLAIAEHEHIPEIVATAYAAYFTRAKNGYETVGQMIIDDIREAQARGDRAHVQHLLHVLHHFIKSHPEAAPKQHPWSSVT